MATIQSKSFTHETLRDLWKEDKEARCRADNLTEIFCQNVPLLDYIGWKITETDLGFTESVLPLNSASSNQHATHQTAVMLAAADYTAGTALGTLLTGTPVIGIHRQKTDFGAYLWTAKSEARWLKPSCDELILRSKVPTEKHIQIVNRFFLAGRYFKK